MKAKLKIDVSAQGAATEHGEGGDGHVMVELELDGNPYGRDPMTGLLRGSLDEARKLVVGALGAIEQRP